MTDTSSRLSKLAEPVSDDHQWHVRSQLWSGKVAKIAGVRAKRERPRSPLILTGHGVSLRIEGGALTIRNGFTHYPQRQETHRFFKGELAIPTRIIMLDGSGSISFDVLAWLSEQRVSLIQMNWKGEVVSIASTNGYAANPFRVNWQIATREHPNKRMEFCVLLITKKIEASILTLEKAIPKSDAWERAIKNAYSALTRLDENPPPNVTELRALEASCSLLSRMARNSDQMARHEPAANSRSLERDWTENVAISPRRKSQCSSSGQRYFELRLCGPSEPNSDQRGCRWI